MLGILGKKLGMTSIFGPDGKNVACTIVQAGPCHVTQVRSEEVDGYEAVQIAYDEKKEKNVGAGLLGHFKKAGVKPSHKVLEIRDYDSEVQVGDAVDLSFLEEGDYVDVTGKSKGKGFQGVVKRHGFKGVGDRTHGQHNRQRAPGSIGMASTPARVLKGMRMAGRMGNDRVKVKNLEVVKVYSDKNIVLLKGAVPGAKGSYVLIEK